MESASDQFNALIQQALSKPKVLSHPDYAEVAANFFEEIEAQGGVSIPPNRWNTGGNMQTEELRVGC